METPVKMSQFEVESPLPSGSYFIVVTPSGSVWNNRKLSVDDVKTTLAPRIIDEYKSSRWLSVPSSTFDSSGTIGSEALGGQWYYLKTEMGWIRFDGTIGF